MKNSILIYLLLLGATTSFFTSCSDDDAPASDKEFVAPVITILEPLNDAEKEGQDTIFIKGNITHDREMHEYAVMVRKRETGEETLLISEHEHRQNIEVDTHFVLNEPTHVHYHVIFIASDHDGSISRDSVLVHVEL